MRHFHEWLEDHWAGVGVTVSIASALTLAVIIAVVFNVVVTRADREHRDSAHTAPQITDAPSPLTRS